MRQLRDTILVFDFGGQYTHLISRNVRENGVYSEIIPCDVSAEKVRKLRRSLNVKGIIFSGGPDSVYDRNAPKFDKRVLGLGIPILGLCYGHQLIAQVTGGRVEPGKRKEYGSATVIIDKPVGVLAGLSRTENVWMSHGDAVYGLSRDYEELARSDNSPIAAFRHKTLRIYGLQWHPEVVHTVHGTKMLQNFIFNECKCKKNWNMGGFVGNSVKEIRQRVGKGRCLVALSGGVDSSVATALVAKAVGRRLTAIYVDTGLMREGETEQIRRIFGKFHIDLRIIDAGERFLKGLRNVSDPEHKRKIIGREFIRVFEEQAKEVGADYLIQGTIYPDRVESGSTGKSALIKSHHNVGGLPKGIKFKAIVEPLKDLYKDEVRNVAKQVGLPDRIVHRQPFPGPGLAVRIIGTITQEKVEIERKADHIVTEEIERSGAAKKLWQYFAVLTDTKATGVKGDSRAYGLVVAIRTVVSREAMTAKFGELPWDLIRRISTRITNEIPQVTRVVYDATDKPPGMVEWE